MAWEIQVEHEGNNPGIIDPKKAATQDNHENMGGLVIYLKDASTGKRQEFSRVTHIRRNSRNPDVDFDTQLSNELSKAKTAVSTMNEYNGTGKAA